MNTPLVQGLYRGLAARDPGTVTAAVITALSPDAVLHVPGSHPLAGRHEGVPAVLRFLAATRAAAGSGEEVDVLDVLSGAEHVAVYCRSRAERDGAVLDNPTVHLLRVADGRIAEIWFHNRDQAPVDAFWAGGVR